MQTLQAFRNIIMPKKTCSYLSPAEEGNSNYEANLTFHLFLSLLIKHLVHLGLKI